MAIMEQKDKFYSGQQNIIMENRKKISISGVEDVDSFDESSIAVQTVMGDLVVSGDGLHIIKFSVDIGELVIEGDIDEVVYREGADVKKSFLSRMFG